MINMVNPRDYNATSTVQVGATESQLQQQRLTCPTPNVRSQTRRRHHREVQVDTICRDNVLSKTYMNKLRGIPEENTLFYNRHENNDHVHGCPSSVITRRRQRSFHTPMFRNQVRNTLRQSNTTKNFQTNNSRSSKNGDVISNDAQQRVMHINTNIRKVLVPPRDK